PARSRGPSRLGTGGRGGLRSLVPFGGGVIGNTTGSGPVIGGSSPPPRATRRTHAATTELRVAGSRLCCLGAWDAALSRRKRQFESARGCSTGPHTRNHRGAGLFA